MANIAGEIWNSRRSPVLSTKGICTSSQPHATAAGVKILQSGGNAADAAVAMAAALNVTEPCSTGIGGDAFALYFDAATKRVHCLMGNGASSRNFSLELLNSLGIGVGEGLKPLDKHSGLTVSVPGAAALWEDLIKNHGTLPLDQILAPAIDLADNGYPISPMTARQCSKGFLQGDEALRVFRPDGKIPKAGDVVYNKDLANTFRRVAALGAKDGFYTGEIAEAVVAAAREFGGVLDTDDLATHTTAFEDPISVVYRGYRIYETPPPTHGIAALIALKMIEKIEGTTHVSGSDEEEDEAFKIDPRRGSEAEAHLAIECMRLAYADSLQHVADPRCVGVPTAKLLSDGYAAMRAALVGDAASLVDPGDPSPFAQGDTVYFGCVDSAGNACSMINSNYMGFGTGIVPRETGFTLQNRGHNVSLQPGHPNQAAPRKRPYHTIIPCLITRESDQSFFATLGNMGGFMQPMGHMQNIRNLIDFKMNPQACVDAPRWYIDGVGASQAASDLKTSQVLLEHGYGGEMDGGEQGDWGEHVAQALRARGHTVGPLVRGNERGLFGRAQIIARAPNGVLWGGSDPRADGCAMPVF